MTEEVKPATTPAPAAPVAPAPAPAEGVPAKPAATPEPSSVLTDATKPPAPENILADAKKPAEAKTDDATKPPEAAVPFDLKTVKLPEGVKLDEATSTAFAEVLNDAKLSSQDRGQKLIEMHTQAMKQVVDTAQNDWQKIQNDWKAEIRADAELGGANYEAMTQSVGKLLDNPAFADKATKEAFLLTGAGNNPAIVRFVSRVAKALTEGGHVAGNPPSPKPKGAAEIMYGTGSQG